MHSNKYKPDTPNIVLVIHEKALENIDDTELTWLSVNTNSNVVRQKIGHPLIVSAFSSCYNQSIFSLIEVT